MNRMYILIILVSLIVAVGAGALTATLAGKQNREDIAQLEGQLQEQSASLAEFSSILTEVVRGNSELEERLRGEEAKRKEYEAFALESSEKFQEKILSLEESISLADITDTVRKWDPHIAKIQCTFEESKSAGSGILSFQAGSPILLTNSHVLDDEEEGLADVCTIFLSNGTKISAGKKTFSVEEGKDIATIALSATGNYPTRAEAVKCSTKPEVGDQVVILGYPSVGSKDSVTATDGIISGFDGDFYITSAKIERGNSGGAAIHVKNDCLLGIPTLTVVGRAESLARILAF